MIEARRQRQAAAALACAIDLFVIDTGFDKGCRQFWKGGRISRALQNGVSQDYLRLVGVAVAVIALALAWRYTW